MDDVQLIIKPFDELTPQLLYTAIKLRQDVFIIEQDCIYDDLDNQDQKCLHLFMMMDGKTAGYSRIVPPGVKFEESSIGRIIISPGFRNRKLGYTLVKKSIIETLKLFPGINIKIEAQAHLEKFYQNLDFETISTPYDVDGIPHIQMILKLNA
jgi:ElaA protein